MFSKMQSRSGIISFFSSSRSLMANPFKLLAKMNGKSIKSSLSVSSVKRSKTLSSAVSGSAAGLSILLITTIIFKPNSSALDRTNLVCGIGPSAASTIKRAPSTIPNTRSTSPPKSACPGVSTTLILVFL